MRNYKNYTFIKKEIKRLSQLKIKSIRQETAEHWEGVCSSWLYKEYLTEKQRTKTTTEQKKIYLNKWIKEEKKNLEKKLKKCDDIASASFPSFIVVSVDWVRSKPWGMNLHAEVRTDDGVFYGKASGCGYDKLSASTADAFNQSLSILKLIYNKYEEILRKNKNIENITIHEAVGYGAGYGAAPYFEGGVGYSCHDSIFRKCGAIEHSWREGKTWDSMSYTFKEIKK